MSQRFLRTILNPATGTTESQNCAGETKLGASGQNYSSTRYLGYSKSPIVVSDRFKPTAYRNYWIREANEGSCGYEFVDETCNMFHPTEKAYFTIAKATGIPYYPNMYYFGMYSPQTYFIYDASQRLTPNALFTRVRTLCEKGVLEKIKQQQMAVPVSIAEGKQTLSLAMDLTKDVASAVRFVIEGVLNRKSLVGKFHDLLDRYKFGKKIPKNTPKPVKRFYHGMRDAFRRKKIKYPDPSIPSDITSRWLQYRYGIMPALGDAEALHNIFYLHALEPFFNGVTSARYRYKNEFRVSGYGNSGTPGIMSVEGTSKVVAEVKLYFKLDSNNQQSVARKLGSSLRDMPSTLYELIPLSFVLDWFIDFGSYFSNLNATYGHTFIQGYFAVKEEVQDKTRFHSAVNGAVKPFQSVSGEEATRRYGVFNRTLYSQFPTATLPSFTFPFGGLFDKRLADSISLFTQMRRGGTVVR